MRKIAILGAVLAVACARGGAPSDSVRAADSARRADSLVVAGAPAVPSTLAPAPDSQVSPKSPEPAARGTARPDTGRSGAPASAAPAADSTRGIVSVVGTSFDKHVMVASPNRRVEIIGPLAGMIGHQAGAEVSVVGTASQGRLAATSFLVRSVDGQPAIDGKLRTEAGVLYIVTADGSRTRIVAPPPPLQGQDGARVWITGDPAKGVSSFGFIDPPR